ncbi:MAG: hypothetical protein HXY25_03445 [Alphaproteobacteria bacterium]|nr:hypothetical protein [Alphaproteobacteria bacterium]
MSWFVVRLELARTKAFIEGSPERGYEFTAPLTSDGHLDEAAWRAAPQIATVRRFWAGEPDEHGRLVHTRGRKWAFSYVPGEDDDEPFFHLETHSLKAGEYVSIREHDGETLPFRIVSVRPVK